MALCCVKNGEAGVGNGSLLKAVHGAPSTLGLKSFIIFIYDSK